MSNTYCPEDELDVIQAYYLNLDHYDTQSVISRYAIYTDESEQNHSYIHEEIALSPGIFLQMHELYDNENRMVQVDRPDRYEERTLYAYSRDGIAFIDLSLALINGQVYCMRLVSGETISGYPLSGELNQYIIEAVFTPTTLDNPPGE